MANKSVEKGELVLITGGTGWVGSHIVDKAIEHGLRVRLAVRNESKAKTLIRGLEEKYGKQLGIETVIVHDFNSQDAYKEAVRGVQGIIHSASNLTFSDQWDDVIPPTIQGYSAILNAAHAQGEEIKRVVVTSTSFAVGSGAPKGSPPTQLTSSSWNDAIVESAKKNPNPISIYGASKVLSERFAWDFIKENKPKFTLNVVNPSFCAGKKAPGSEYLSTALLLRKAIFDQDENPINTFPSSHIVDTNDVAILHILAITQKEIVNERILAFSEIYTWNKIFDLAESFLPTNKVNHIKRGENTATENNSIADLTRTHQLLKPYGGLKSLEEIVRSTLLD